MVEKGKDYGTVVDAVAGTHASYIKVSVVFPSGWTFRYSVRDARRRISIKAQAAVRT